MKLGRPSPDGLHRRICRLSGCHPYAPRSSFQGGPSDRARLRRRSPVASLTPRPPGVRRPGEHRPRGSGLSADMGGPAVNPRRVSYGPPGRPENWRSPFAPQIMPPEVAPPRGFARETPLAQQQIAAVEPNGFREPTESDQHAASHPAPSALRRAPANPYRRLPDRL